jgi:glycosyltransferase involved in cell wall biosynthesis
MTGAIAMPRVSIGVPVYNGGRFLERALQCLVSQTFSDIEIIISDNASTDNTSEIIERFSAIDSRIRVIRQPVLIEAIENFNAVVKEAAGEFFMWAASDDEWEPKWIEKLLAEMQDPSVCLAFGHLVNIDKDGVVIKKYKFIPFYGNALLQRLQYYFRDEHDGKANIIYGIYRTSVIKKNPFREILGCVDGSDVHFVYSMLKHGKLKTIPEVYMRKRISSADAKGEGGGKVKKINLLEKLVNFRRVHYLFGYFYLSDDLLTKMIILIAMPYRYFAMKRLSRRLKAFYRRYV